MRIRHHILFIIFLLGFVFLIYQKTLFYPFVQWDDPAYVAQNTLIQNLSLKSLREMFTQPHFNLYIPLTLASYASDFQVFHFDSWGYHWTNTMLHLANVVLVYGIVTFLTGEWVAGLGVALLFGVHPVQIESVVWISERKNVLSAFFFLASFLFYYLSGVREKRQKVFLLVSWLLFLGACFSKPSSVVLPLLFLVFDSCFSSLKKERWKTYLPFFAVSLFFAFLNCVINQSEGGMNYFGGSFGKTMLAMVVVMMKYFELLFFPLKLQLTYDFPVYTFITHPHVAAGLLGLVLIFCGLAFLFTRDKKLFFWGSWYLILLLPVMNFIPFPSLMNDRYLYLALIGVFTVLFSSLHKKAGLLVTAVVMIFLTAGFTFLNLKRQPVWASPDAVWTETRWTQPGNLWSDVKKKIETRHENPDLILAHDYLFGQGKIGEAIELFQKVLAESEDPNAYGGLGSAYLMKGDFAKSIDYFKKAMAMVPQVPTFHNNLALAYARDKQFDLATKEYQNALALNPTDFMYHYNFAAFLEEMLRTQEAEKEYLEAFRLNPDFPDTLYNLGRLYHLKKDFDKARKFWSRLLAVSPQHPKAPLVSARMRRFPK